MNLTQDFFVMILESDWLRLADTSRGRFGSFLLKSLQKLLSHCCHAFAGKEAEAAMVGITPPSPGS